MIKEKEYTNLICATSEYFGKVFDYEEISMFWKLRKLFLKFIKEASYHFYYPKVDVNEKIRPYALDVVEFCKSNNIQYKFYDLTKETHKEGKYVDFYYKGSLITNMIDLEPGKKEFKYS
jgi:hypothetical protein